MSRDKYRALEHSAAAYENTVISGWEGLYREKQRRLIEAFAPYMRGNNALELGVADGEMSVRLAAFFPRLTIIDGSKLHLEQAKARLAAAGHGQVTAVHALFEEYAPTERFDAIFMAHVLEHLDDPVAVLRRAASWLTESGRIFCAVPNANSLHRHIGVKLGQLERIDSLHAQDILVGHQRVYVPDSLRRDVAAAGLRRIKFGGLMVKPLSNRQMNDWPQEILEALFAISEEFPEICSEIYVVAEQ
ncbi:class I SAM-dependent methyltransferase [Solidesulfovibrio sp. C21]|uniref:class I SAM-dependent methyltransferase n=1 Tax=Solidesulfovibrio sp. C21 TaxID=3398613 RepID=UPI0039FDA6C4